MCRHDKRPLLLVKRKGRPSILHPDGNKHYRIAVFAREVESQPTEDGDEQCRDRPVVILKASDKYVFDIKSGQVVGPYSEPKEDSEPVICSHSFVDLSDRCMRSLHTKNCSCNQRKVLKKRILQSYLQKNQGKVDMEKLMKSHTAGSVIMKQDNLELNGKESLISSHKQDKHNEPIISTKTESNCCSKAKNSSRISPESCKNLKIENTGCCSGVKSASPMPNMSNSTEKMKQMKQEELHNDLSGSLQPQESLLSASPNSLLFLKSMGAEMQTLKNHFVHNMGSDPSFFNSEPGMCGNNELAVPPSAKLSLHSHTEHPDSIVGSIVPQDSQSTAFANTNFNQQFCQSNQTSDILAGEYIQKSSSMAPPSSWERMPSSVENRQLMDQTPQTLNKLPISYVEALNFGNQSASHFDHQASLLLQNNLSFDRASKDFLLDHNNQVYKVLNVPSCSIPGSCLCSEDCSCSSCETHNPAKSESNQAQFKSDCIPPQPMQGFPTKFAHHNENYDMARYNVAVTRPQNPDHYAFLSSVLGFEVEPSPEHLSDSNGRLELLNDKTGESEMCSCAEDSCFCSNCERHGIIEGVRLDDIFASVAKGTTMGQHGL